MIIGSAEVVIRAVTTGVEAQIKKALRDARGGVRDEGKAAGTEYSKGFSDSAGVGVERGVSDALKRSGKSAEDAGIDSGIDYSSGFNDSTDAFLGHGIDDSLRRSGKNANVEGGTAGREYSQGFSDTSENNITASISRAFNSANASGSGSSVGSSFSRAFRSSIDRDSRGAGLSGGNAFTRAFSSITDSFRVRGDKFFSGGFTDDFKNAQAIFRGLYTQAATLGPVLAIAGAGLSSLASGLSLVALSGAQAAGSLAVLPGLISALAQGGIVLAIATKGVGAAIKAGLAPAADSTAKTAKAVAAASDTAAQKARAVSTAQEALARAYEDADKRSRDAMQRVQGAEEDVAQAYEDSSKRSRDALQRVQSAEEDLGDAQNDVRLTQLALNDARDAGAESLQQLGFSAEDAVLSEQRAAFKLQDALDDLLKVQDTPVGTRVRDEAELNFKEAELQYRESKDRAQDLTKEQEKAAQAGVDGTKEVIDAKNAVINAQNKEVDATLKLRDAQESQADVARQNERAVSDANDRLRDAQEAQADAARQSARAIEDASRALADAQAASAKALDDVSDAADGASTAVDKYADALKNLAPNQQSFVKAVIDSKDQWKEFKTTLGDNLFAGLDASFAQVTSLVTQKLQPGLAETSSILNDMAKNFVNAFTMPENASGLQNIIAGNNKILDIFNKKTSNGASTIENLTTVFIRLGQAIQPVTEKFANWVSKTVTGWADATDPAKGGGDVLVDFFNRSGNAAAAWGETFGNVFGAFKNIMKGAQGPISDFLVKMIASTQKLEDFTKTAADNGNVKKFFDGISENAGAILSFLKEVGKAFVGIGKDPNVKRSFDVLTKTVSESFGTFFDQLARVGPFLARAFDSAIKLMNEIGQNEGFVIFFKVLKGGIETIKWMLDHIPGLAIALGFGAVIGATTGAITLLWKALELVFKAFLAGPSAIFGWVQGLRESATAAAAATAANDLLAASARNAGTAAATAGTGVVAGAAARTTAAAASSAAIPASVIAARGGVPAAASAAAVVPAAGVVSRLSKFGSILSKVGGALPVIGIAALAAGSIISAFGDKSEEASKKQEEFAAATKEVQGTLDAQTAAVTDNTKSWVLQQLATSGALKNMQTLGINSQAAVEGVLGVGDAAASTSDQINTLRLQTLHTAPGYDALRDKAATLNLTQEQLDHTLLTGEGMDQLNAGLKTGKENYAATSAGAIQATTTTSLLGDVMNGTADKLNGLNQVEGSLAETTKHVNDAQAAQEVLARGAAIVAGDLAGAVSGTAESYSDLIPTIDTATDSQSDWNDETDEASQVVDNVIAALDRLNGAVPSVDDSMSALNETIDNSLDGYKKLEDGSIDLSEAVLTQEGAFNTATETGRTYRDSLKDQRDATVTAAKAAFDAAGGLGNLEAAQAASNKVTADSLTAWEETSAQLGISKEDADKLAASMGLIPETVTSEISIETTKAGIDLDKFAVDASGKVIGMKVDPNTVIAQDIVSKFAKDDHGNIIMPIDPNVPDAERQLGQFVKDESGTIIGFQTKANITPAKQATDGLIRDIEGKPIGLAIDPKTVQAGADMDKFILDQEGKPIGLAVDPLSNNPTKIVNGWITDQTGKKIALASDPLGNDPTTILNGWVTSVNGTKYQLFADTGSPQATADVNAWVTGVNNNPDGNTYNLNPNTNSDPSNPASSATQQVTGWIDGVNGAPGKFTYDVHPDANAAREPGSEASQEVDGWITWSDSKGKEYQVWAQTNPDHATADVDGWRTVIDASGREYKVYANTQQEKATQDVDGWIKYIDNAGKEVLIPIKATVQTQVAPPDAGALANVWNAYGLGNDGGFAIPWGTSATGGYIKGPGGPTDDQVYTRLSNGEFVIRASSVKRIGLGTLRMLNSGLIPDDFPRFARGGQVTKSLMSKRISSTSKGNKDYIVPDIDFGTIDGGTDPFISGVAAHALQGWTNPFESWATTWNDGITANLNAAFGKVADWVKEKFTPTSSANLEAFTSSQNPSSFGWAQGTSANINSGYQWNGYGFPSGVARGTEGLWNALLTALVPSIPGGLNRGELWGYENRSIAGTNTPSFHSYGLALDINSGSNSRGLPGYGRGGQYVIPGDVAHRLAGQFGMEWGGDWSYTDPMHFEIHLPPSAIGSAAAGIAKTVSNMISGASNTSGVEQWRATVVKALQLTGQSLGFADIVLNQMRTESSGNINAINLTDSNARKGTPSKGLMQVIDPTFQSYRLSNLSSNIYDPLANIVAAIRYVLAQYGSIPAGMQGHAYDTGGMLSHMGTAFNLSGKPERVLDPRQTVAFETLVNTITKTTGPGGYDGSGGLSMRDHSLINAVVDAVTAHRNDTHVRVFIGQTELTGIIDTQIMTYDHGTATAVSLGRKP